MLPRPERWVHHPQWILVMRYMTPKTIIVTGVSGGIGLRRLVGYVGEAKHYLL